MWVIDPEVNNSAFWIFITNAGDTDFVSALDAKRSMKPVNTKMVVMRYRKSLL